MTPRTHSSSSSPLALLPALAENWLLLLLRGIVTIAFGVLAFIWPGVLSENHIRTYWWCSPARIGMAEIAPERWTARCRGASFCNAKCVRA
jgi:hypothetical protein